MKAILTIGVSASGKSSWARAHAKNTKAIITNRDDLRFSLTGCDGWGDYKFNRDIEDIVTNLQFSAAQQAKEKGKDIIFADTNLDYNRREELVKRLKFMDFDIEYQTFPVTLEEAWRRDGLRPNGVGRDVIYKQWQQWLKFIGRPTYTPNESLPKAVIFDVDGTLTHMNGRKPYDWDKVGMDTFDPIVQQMYWDFQKRGYKMIIVSGRDGVCREQTYQSFVENGIIYDEFLMRAEGDQRKDTVIKEEIFWRDIAPHYNVQAVIDDRPCVVRMWNDIGINKVIAVGNQNVEF